MLWQYLTLFIAFLGIPVGLGIAHFTKEEVIAGKQYFQWLQYTILFLFITILSSLFFSRSISLLLAFIIIILFFTVIRPDALLYTVLTVPFAFVDQKTFALLAVLLFIYGLPTAAIELHPYLKKKSYKKEVINIINRHAWFILVAFLLLYV